MGDPGLADFQQDAQTDVGYGCQPQAVNALQTHKGKERKIHTNADAQNAQQDQHPMNGNIGTAVFWLSGITNVLQRSQCVSGSAEESDQQLQEKVKTDTKKSLKQEHGHQQVHDHILRQAQNYILDDEDNK